MVIVKQVSDRKPFNTLIRNLPAIEPYDKKKVQRYSQQQQLQQQPQQQEEEKSFDEWLQEMMTCCKKPEDRILFACYNGSDQISVQLLNHVLSSVIEAEEAACTTPLHKIRDTTNHKNTIATNSNNTRDNMTNNSRGNGCSLLHICAKLNKTMTMEYLFKNNHFPASAIDLRNDIQATPLIYAVAHNSKEACAMLLSLGANPNAKDTYNKFPLLLSMKNKNYEVAELLLSSSRSCDLHLKGTKGNTVLHTMAYDGDLEGVKFLMEKGASPFRRNYDEEHVLFSCVGHLEITDYICRNSKSSTLLKMILFENAFGRNILHECCCNSGSTMRSNELTSLLCLFKYVVVEYDSPLSEKQVHQLLNHIDQRGDTPLLSAVKNSKYDLVEFLCQCKELELDEPDSQGLTALSHASGVKDKQMSTILTKYGASVKSNKERELEEDESQLFIHRSWFMKNWCFSIRTGIIATSVIQVLICCFSIWIASFFLSRNAKRKTSIMLMEEIGQKASYFIDQVMLPPRTNAFLLADAYEIGVLTASNASLPFLFSHAKQFKFAALALGEDGHNSYTAVETIQVGNKSNMIWQTKEDSTTDIGEYILDEKTGAIVAPYAVVKDYDLNTRAWYQESIVLEKGQGMWGSSFSSLGIEGLTTYYTVPVFKDDKKMGLVKNNVPLTQLGDNMSNMKLLGRGYALIVEGNGNVIASSIDLSKYFNLSTSPSMFNITERNMGKLARVIHGKLGGTFTVSSQSTVKFRVGTSRYEVTVVPYDLDNLRWSILVVFYDSDLYNAVNTAAYVTMGIALIVLFIGMAIAALSGYIITQPLSYLPGEFDKVANMDLESVKKRNSIFTEINQIYKSLDHMTTWLKEFRAFLPESILLTTKGDNNNNNNNYDMNGEDTDNNNRWSNNYSTTAESQTGGEIEMKTVQPKHQNKKKEKKKGNSEDTHSSSSSLSSRSSSSTNSSNMTRQQSIQQNRNKMDKFKLGLSGKTATVLVIGINNQDQFYNLPPVDIVHAYSKLFSACSTLANQSRGVLQVLPQTLSLWIYYDGHSQESRAVQTALDLIEYSTTVLNQQLLKEKYPPLEITCGIDTSYVLAGNMGVANTRLFSIVGTLLKRAEQLQVYSYEMRLKLIVSENTWTKCQHKYNGRPVDIWTSASTTTRNRSRSFGEATSVTTIYEVVSKVVIPEDQWVHELDSNHPNNMTTTWSQDWSNYMNGYYTILNGNVSHLEEARLLFEEHLSQFPDDVPTLNWISVINAIQQKMKKQQQQHTEPHTLVTTAPHVEEAEETIESSTLSTFRRSNLDLSSSLSVASIQYHCAPKTIYQKMSQGFELDTAN